MRARAPGAVLHPIRCHQAEQERDALTYAHRKTLVELIAHSAFRRFIHGGPGASYTEQHFSQAADYVIRILKGEKPAELPVQAPTKLVLVINATTAKTLGLEISARLMALADELIE